MPVGWQICSDLNLPIPEKLILMKLKGVDTNSGIRKGAYTDKRKIFPETLGHHKEPLYKFLGDGAWFSPNDIEQWMYVPEVLRL
jgi:hypothetical protein